MITTDNTKAILLLRLKSICPVDIEVLKPAEIKKIIALLSEIKKEPSDLLKDNKKILNLIESKLSIKESRISKLVSSSMALSLKLSNWSKLGIWVISSLDHAQYPAQLKMKYRDQLPLLIFGSGNQEMLHKGGVGMVGSRAITPNEHKYAALAAEKFVRNNIPVITGGAKGIDEISMMSALENGGEVICILPSELSKKVLLSNYREFIENQKLTLLSIEDPDSGWSAGRAMARNKFIYLLSNGVLVVASGLSGGTWSGAMECIKKNWVSVYVKPSNDEKSGVNDLIEAGAKIDSEITLGNFTSSLDYSLMYSYEIAAIENKSVRSIKSKLTKLKVKSLDSKQKEVKIKKEGNPKVQKDLF